MFIINKEGGEAEELINEAEMFVDRVEKEIEEILR